MVSGHVQPSYRINVMLVSVSWWGITLGVSQPHAQMFLVRSEHTLNFSPTTTS